MHIPLPSTLIRFLLRAYFIATLLFIAFVGDAVCRSRNKLKLLRGEPLTVAGMTGWVKGWTSLGTTARLRRLPGGWLGALMLLAAVLGIVSDLGVSVFVSQFGHSSRCRFERGIVLSNTASRYPSVAGLTYLQASNAQLYSVENFNGYEQGRVGIYRNVPNDSNIFPWAMDVVGQWECRSTSPPLGYTGSSDLEIVSSLVDQGLLHPYNATKSLVNHDEDYRPYGNSTQLVVVSVPSIVLGESWDNVVKIALDVEDSEDGNKKTMQPYRCLLQANEEDVHAAANGQLLRDIVQSIDIEWALNTWMDSIQGALYVDFSQSATVEYPNETMAWLLNSMIMVSGGLNVVTSEADGVLDTFGCLLPGTSVPTGIGALVLIVGAMVVSLVAYYCHLVICIRRARRHYDAENDGRRVSSKELCDNVPNGLLDWMSHAAHESNTMAARPRHHHLRGWLFSTHHHSGRRMGVVPKHNSNPVLPSPIFTDASTPSMMQSTDNFRAQKTGYMAVETQEVRG